MFGLDHPDDDVAIIDVHRSVTWGQYRDRVARLISGLSDLGIGRGDSVAVLLSNRSEFYEVLAACVWSGVDWTPLNQRLTVGEISYILEDSGASAIFLDAALADRAEEMTGVDSLERIVVGEPVAGLRKYEDLIDARAPATFAAEGPAGIVLPYTSGTTGRPKGVVRPGMFGKLEKLSLANVLHGDAPIIEMYRIPEGPHLVAGPLFGGSPWLFGWMALRSGNQVVILDSFTPVKFFDAVETHRIVSTHMVSTMFIRLLREPERASFDHSSLSRVVHGAAPTSVLLKREMIEWWGPVFTEYYGGTEGGLTVVHSEDWLEHPGTVGRPATPGGKATYEVLICDAEGHPRPPREVGRVYFRNGIRGFGTFAYRGDPDKTAAAHLDPDTFTVGDLGFVDEDGYLYLTGRASDMIISGGSNVYPAEAEAVLQRHPAVADVAVIGVPDAEWGESVLAIVQLEAGVVASQELTEELISFTKSSLASYKSPKAVLFDSLPRDQNGKLSKLRVRERYDARMAEGQQAETSV
jgi:long-chain acyl-CoA synthetase